MKSKLLTLFLTVMMLSSFSLIAQDEMPLKMREKVKDLLIWKLTDKLNLTEDQSAKFFPLFNRFLDDHEKLMDERRNLLRDLKEGEKLSDSQLNEKSNRILKIDRERADNLQKIATDSEKILSAKQRADLIIFQTEFIRDLAKMIEKRKSGRRSFQENDK